MTASIYTIERHDTVTGERVAVSTCDNVFYEIGERDALVRRVTQLNRASKLHKWQVAFRVVPLPFTTSLPDWFDYA